jgi:proliferating cell nuclear antigen
MKIQISDKKKKDIFVSVFYLLKCCTNAIHLTFDTDFIYIQGMDKSHICLFDTKICKEWFTEYDIKEVTKISFDTTIFHSIISTKSDNQDFIIRMDSNDPDTLYINFAQQESKKSADFKKSFKMSLIDYEYEEMLIPNTEYDAEFSLSSKQISELFSQLGNFGNDIRVECTEEKILLTAQGDNGEMQVDIPIEDLSGYSIVEGEKVELTYSLAYINKMCITNKLSNDIDFSLSNDRPMKISYNLGDNSVMSFFIVPKMKD